MIKIGDFFVVFILLIIITAMFLGTDIKQSNAILIKTHENDLLYNIDENRIIEIDGRLGKSVIKIENKEVYFDTSPCQDKLCIKNGVLKNIPLVCLPNYITISFTRMTDKETGITIDAFVR